MVDAQKQEALKMMHARVVNGSKCKMECVMAAKPITINKAHCMCRHMGQVEACEICKIAVRK
jgi:hypothetical protein